MTALAMQVKAPTCPTCQATAELVDSAVVYGKSYGPLWLCPTPACDSYVGTHPDGTPLGTMAGPMLRRARRLAHDAFDSWWQWNGLRRKDAYTILRWQMGVGHIAHMNEQQCAKVVEIFSPMPALATFDGALTRGQR